MMCKFSPTVLSAIILYISILRVSTQDDKELAFTQLLEKMQYDTLAFRDEIEAAYVSRCNLKTLADCGHSNYDDCTSVYPEQRCMEKDELVMSDCGDGDPCNALWDMSVSSVHIPGALAKGNNGNPTDPEIIETVCYTLQAEDYMVQKYKEGISFWGQYGVTPMWAYFGAHNGAFRIHPSTHSKECGIYDPRKRPWYIAASSGPKDVVMVMDVSGSMANYGRIELAKEAAKTVIETLTVADRVAVIEFSADANLIGGQDRLIRTTKESKEVLLAAISGLEPKTSTNFYAGFKKAFDSIDTTINYESTTGCNIAILFLTDGKITEGGTKEDVINLVNNRTTQIANRWERNVHIFTYSLGHDADHDVMKAVACQTGGLWSPVEDKGYGNDLVTSMSNYYKLFALGLGEGKNEKFTAWVEPYVFFTAGKMGTTVSAPVYYRLVDPPLFLGVVGIDSYMDALEQVLGEDASSSEMLAQFVRVSTAHCPKLSLTECELDALRYLGGGIDAMCGMCNNTDLVGIVPEECPSVSDYPRDLWNNNYMKDKSYEDRACCEVGGTKPSDICPTGLSTGAFDNTVSTEAIDGPPGLSTGAIVGIAAGAFVAVGWCLIFFWYVRKRSVNRQGAESSRGLHVHEGLSIVMPPPTSPSYQASAPP